jgi:hypothetical protein
VRLALGIAARDCTTCRHEKCGGLFDAGRATTCSMCVLLAAKRGTHYGWTPKRRSFRAWVRDQITLRVSTEQ